MESMIEKVARAMSDLYDGSGSDLLHYRYESNVDGYRELARAAIEAMREPTEAMIDRGCAAKVDLYPAWPGEKPQPTAGDVASVAYTAMINAALKE